MEAEHALLVVHVDFDLLLGLGVRDGVAVADLDFGAIFTAGAEKGADDALLVGGTARGVVEDAEECLRLDGYVDRGGGGLVRGDGGGRERAGEVEVVGRHVGWYVLRRGRVCSNPRRTMRLFQHVKVTSG